MANRCQGRKKRFVRKLARAGFIFNLPLITLLLLSPTYKVVLSLGEVQALLDLKAQGKALLTLLSWLLEGRRGKQSVMAYAGSKFILRVLAVDGKQLFGRYKHQDLLLPVSEM
jgi:hypothetical protein